MGEYKIYIQLVTIGVEGERGDGWGRDWDGGAEQFKK